MFLLSSLYRFLLHSVVLHFLPDYAPVPRKKRYPIVILQSGILVCNIMMPDRLVGLVVRRPPREWKFPGSNPACAGIFSGLSHTSDSKIGTPVATLSGAWRYRVSAGTGRPGVSIL